MGFPEGTPTIEVTLGGKQYPIAATMEAARRMTERFGNLELDMSNFEEGVLTWPARIWACMCREDREALSPEDIGEMVHIDNLEAVIEQTLPAIGKLLTIKGAPEGNVEEPAPVKAGTGPKRKSGKSTDSGQSGSTTSDSPAISSGR